MIMELPGTDITLHETLGGSERDLADLLDVHRELFPDYAYYQPYMRDRATLPPDARATLIEHWWLVRVRGEAAGLRLFDYVSQRDCGLGLMVGVRPAYRRLTVENYQRLSEVLLRKTLDCLEVDAQRLGRPTPIGMVSEIEEYILPRCLEYGYVVLPIEYQEPSFIVSRGASETESITFRPIKLACLPTRPGQFDPGDSDVLTNVTKAFLLDHYGLTEDHPIVRQALDSVESRKKS